MRGGICFAGEDFGISRDEEHIIIGEGLEKKF
jgi:hypothetical protein